MEHLSKDSGVAAIFVDRLHASGPGWLIPNRPHYNAVSLPEELLPQGPIQRWVPTWPKILGTMTAGLAAHYRAVLQAQRKLNCEQIRVRAQSSSHSLNLESGL